MLQKLANQLSWFRPGRPELIPAYVPPPPVEPAHALVAAPNLVWPPERIAAAEALWGIGFLQPGGSIEVQRLVNPLGLSSASTLLMLGGGTGGPLRTLVEMGPWVGCFEADAELLAIAAGRKLPAKLAKRVSLQALNPVDPGFRSGYYHHGLALQPFRYGTIEAILSSCEAALKPYGQLVVLDVVADRPPAARDPTMRAWMQADGRLLDLPVAAAVTRALTRLGFDVHVMEDLSQNHERQVIAGWCRQLQAMERARPANAFAAALVQEAERWLLRMRLMQTGQLKLMRWHAMKSGRRPEH